MRSLLSEENIFFGLVALLVLVISFTAGTYFGTTQSAVRTVIVQNNTASPALQLNDLPVERRSIELLLPGVDNEKRGAVTTLRVEIRNGSGQTFVAIGEGLPVLENQTISSVKNATGVASEFDVKSSTHFETSDLFFFFDGNSETVGGTSAGAAMAITAIALLRGDELKPNTAITGRVYKNGSIGSVGEVLEKARVLKTRGVTTFIVPIGQSVIERDEVINGQVQTTRVNVSLETSLNVIEVISIAGAYQLMARR